MIAVYFASRVLTPAEQNYSTTKRECLAVYWALRKFRHLILGYKVHILTDHKPICDLFKKRSFTSNLKFNRWFISVLEFNPEFRYIPGKWNTMADGLSRSHEDKNKIQTTRSFCFSCEVVDLDLDMVKSEQMKDDNTKCIINDLLQDENLRPGFELINGILYKKAPTEKDCSRLYIPHTLILEVLKLTHSHCLAGHPGVKKTIRVITRNYFWPHFSRDARK